MGLRRSIRTGGIGRVTALPSTWVQFARVLRGSRIRDQGSVPKEHDLAFFVGAAIGLFLAAVLAVAALALFICFLVVRRPLRILAMLVNRRAVGRALVERSGFVALAEEHFAPTDEEIRRWAAQVQALSAPWRLRRAGAIRVHLDCLDGRMRYRVGGPRWAEPAIKQAAWAAVRLVP